MYKIDILNLLMSLLLGLNYHHPSLLELKFLQCFCFQMLHFQISYPASYQQKLLLVLPVIGTCKLIQFKKKGGGGIVILIHISRKILSSSE